MNLMKKTLLVGNVTFFVSLLMSLSASAGVSPFGFSVIDPVQVPFRDFSITGLRMSVLWGNHSSVSGIDFGGIGNITQQHFGGIGISSIFNLNNGTSTIVGLQFAGFANMNMNKATILGIQATAGVNLNNAESSLVGAQIAGVSNYSPYTDVYGFQLSMYNRGHTVTGFQIGLVNDADLLHGIQIGLLNFNRKGMFSVAPVINIGF